MNVIPKISLAVAAIFLAMPGHSLAARSPADQALYEKAVAECNGPSYPSGTIPRINYKGGWFTCKEPKTDSKR